MTAQYIINQRLKVCLVSVLIIVCRAGVHQPLIQAYFVPCVVREAGFRNILQRELQHVAAMGVFCSLRTMLTVRSKITANRGQKHRTGGGGPACPKGVSIGRCGAEKCDDAPFYKVWASSPDLFPWWISAGSIR